MTKVWLGEVKVRIPTHRALITITSKIRSIRPPDTDSEAGHFFVPYLVILRFTLFSWLRLDVKDYRAKHILP